MRANEINLEFADLIAGDANVAQLSHAGGNCVSQLIAGNKCVYDGPSPVDGLACICQEQNRAPFGRYLAYRRQGQIVSVKV
jgi:hypothetical protein